MIIHFIIRNFGKIESADIPLNNLLIFVGNNNSGKTLLMQLIYGIRKELENFPVPIFGAKKSDLNGQYLIRCDHAWFKEVESEINTYLSGNQSRIISDIFGIPISAEEIKISLEDNEAEYFVSSVSEYRPDGVKKEGSKVIDITAVILSHDEKYIRWHLYDIKRTLAGAATIIKLFNQWNAGLNT